MLFYTAVFLTLLGCGAQAYSVDLDTELSELEADPRLFFVNFTSSLIQVNTTILAYGLIALAIAAGVAIALYYLYVESTSNSSSGYGYGQGYGQNYGYQQYARLVGAGGGTRTWLREDPVTGAIFISVANFHYIAHNIINLTYLRIPPDPIQPTTGQLKCILENDYH